MIQLKGKLAKLLVLFGLCLVFGGVFGILGIKLSEVFFDVEINSIKEILDSPDPATYSSVLKFIQGFQSFGLFIFPAILFALLFKQGDVFKVSTRAPLRPSTLLILFFLFLCYLPLINFTVELNSYLRLPSFLAEIEQWMRSSEGNAELLTEVLLVMNSPSDLLLNLLIIGVLPALGEELIFRGYVQQILNRGRKKGHFGIWISALLFSALHLQFFGFLPRLLLGAFFGYLFYWSRNMWVPIIAHFINNGTAVVVAYAIGASTMEEKVDTIGTSDNLPYLNLLFVVLFIALFYLAKKHLTANSSNTNSKKEDLST